MLIKKIFHRIKQKGLRDTLLYVWNIGIADVLDYYKYSFQKKYKYPIGGYISAKDTIKKAKSSGLTVCEYVENLWNIKGQTDEIISELRIIGALKPCEEVCEIGPGTGRYLERILLEVKPKRYHIYEVAWDWAKYLEKKYSPAVIRHNADGHTLRYTPDNSCGLVVAFGVFVYLPVLNSFEYFMEMCRVVTKNGYIVFDCFLDESWNETVIQKWIASGHTYPALLPINLLVDFFKRRGCKLIHRFSKKYGCDFSDYLVFRKEE